MDAAMTLSYGLSILVFTIPAFISALILSGIKSGIVRALAILPIYGAACFGLLYLLAYLSAAGFELALFATAGFVVAVPMGLVLMLILLYVWDKKRDGQVEKAFIIEESRNSKMPKI